MTSQGSPRTIGRGRSSTTRLSSFVYEHVKEGLLDGYYGAGERLFVEELGHHFGVSKQPVMEALRLLSADGLVTITPQVGCRVACYEPAEVEDFFTLFGSMEGTVTGLAAARRSISELHQLDAVEAQIAKLSNEEDDPSLRSRGYRMLNRQFHATIYSMAHSRVVAEVSPRMWDLSDFLINNTSEVPYPLHTALEDRHADHERIRKALWEQNTRVAQEEAETHIIKTLKVIHAEA